VSCRVPWPPRTPLHYRTNLHACSNLPLPQPLPGGHVFAQPAASHWNDHPLPLSASPALPGAVNRLMSARFRGLASPYPSSLLPAICTFAARSSTLPGIVGHLASGRFSGLPRRSRANRPAPQGWLPAHALLSPPRGRFNGLSIRCAVCPVPAGRVPWPPRNRFTTRQTDVPVVTFPCPSRSPAAMSSPNPRPRLGTTILSPWPLQRPPTASPVNVRHTAPWPHSRFDVICRHGGRVGPTPGV